MATRECIVAGELVGMQLKLRCRFYSDGTTGVRVLECPQEIGLGNIALSGGTYCGDEELKHVQMDVNASTGEFAIVLRLVGTFDNVHGFRGKWFNSAINLQGTGLFHLPLSTENISTHRSSPLYPLVPGKYAFTGGAIGANGRVYPSCITLQLIEGEAVNGFVQEYLVPQQCQIKGTWTPNQISWRIQYVVENLSSEYVYYATPMLRLLRGAWQRCNVDEIESLAAESGRFDYELDYAERRWCRKYHKYFPPLFQSIVKTLLYSNSRPKTNRLPSDLWCHVFTFVHYDWFIDPIE
ncbi:hypothetical protein THRCLA_04226 [Thraustotheca clavata]|uniref:Uncharacterized protein n=1 Tax=Thraustotheca clavata TaxID=74557 RepID=A0A1V9ZZV0_9STRA|nr:hypothetical protein THRCLA_04226 [Thraustotheca clavata]